MKFAKVRNTKLDLNYDWMMVIESIEQLNDFHQKWLASKIGRAWTNLFEVQMNKAHIDNTLARLINIEAELGNEKSLIELTCAVSAKIYKAKAEAILNEGIIYIAKTGGFFPHHEDIEVLEEIESDNYIYPSYSEKDIRIKQWDGGVHWYSYVGDLRVEEDGKQKWDTEGEARSAAFRFIWKLDDSFVLKTY